MVIARKIVVKYQVMERQRRHISANWFIPLYFQISKLIEA